MRMHPTQTHNRRLRWTWMAQVWTHDLRQRNRVSQKHHVQRQTPQYIPRRPFPTLSRHLHHWRHPLFHPFPHCTFLCYPNPRVRSWVAVPHPTDSDWSNGAAPNALRLMAWAHRSISHPSPNGTPTQTWVSFPCPSTRLCIQRHTKCSPRTPTANGRRFCTRCSRETAWVWALERGMRLNRRAPPHAHDDAIGGAAYRRREQ
ncbi:hypothetical protein L210DRAFT_3535665 [Boletus edulis BED1]|uniref:Uncharacterized protein n=1 Tax=Boletus edulis BED1 TaxID=1328754 RepID=A0AAD4BWF3_BOLED|nr:hypothetical protein L210DRAFT_3535665 [Boletus edulis BED1]